MPLWPFRARSSRYRHVSCVRRVLHWKHLRCIVLVNSTWPVVAFRATLFMLNKCSGVLEWAVFNGAERLVSLALLASFVSNAANSSLEVNFPRSGVTLPLSHRGQCVAPVVMTVGAARVLAVNFLFRMFTVWIACGLPLAACFCCHRHIGARRARRCRARRRRDRWRRGAASIGVSW